MNQRVPQEQGIFGQQNNYQLLKEDFVSWRLLRSKVPERKDGQTAVIPIRSLIKKYRDSIHTSDSAMRRSRLR
jgi:hypothetical protein